MTLELTEEQKKAGWQVKQLGDIAPLKYGKGLPQVKRVPGSVPVYSSAGISGWHNEHLIDGTHIVIGRKGSIGTAYWAEGPAFPIDTTFYTAGSTDINLRWVYYLLKTFSFAEMNNDSAVPGLNREVFESQKVLVPPQPEQKRIAEVLGSVDDKIEANSRLLDSLDELLRLEYIAVQGDSELKISDIASEVKDGVSPSGILSDEVYVGLEHLPRHDVWLREWGRGEEVTSNKARFKKGDILFGKLRPYFHKVVIAPVDGICSTDIIVARPKQGFESLALQALSSDEVVAHATNASNGTRMPRAKWSDLKDLEVRGSAELKSVVSFELAAALVAENRQLAETRDLLIRQLMK